MVGELLKIRKMKKQHGGNNFRKSYIYILVDPGDRHICDFCLLSLFILLSMKNPLALTLL
jgi:hypothetical protein